MTFTSVGIRSKKLLYAPTKLGLPWQSFYGNYHEDGFLCVHHHKELEQDGCKFAPIDVARYFSHETPIPEIEGIKPFAFHKWDGSNALYPRFDNSFIRETYKKLKVLWKKIQKQ